MVELNAGCIDGVTAFWQKHLLEKIALNPAKQQKKFQHLAIWRKNPTQP